MSEEDLEQRICNIEACLDTLFDHLFEKYPDDPKIKSAWDLLGL